MHIQAGRQAGRQAVSRTRVCIEMVGPVCALRDACICVEKLFITISWMHIHGSHVDRNIYVYIT